MNDFYSHSSAQEVGQIVEETSVSDSGESQFSFKLQVRVVFRNGMGEPLWIWTTGILFLFLSLNLQLLSLSLSLSLSLI